MHNLDKEDKAEAYYIQLVTYFRNRIYNGDLSVGERLPTEIQLAEQHQISRGTVRQALKILVNEGLLERIPGRGTFVREIADILNPEQEFSSNRKRIGLVLSTPTIQLSMDILLGVEQAAKLRGYEVSLSFADNSQEQQSHDIEQLKANGVAGIILFPVDNATKDETLMQLKVSGTHLVLVDRYLPDLDTDYVVSDNMGGAYRVTEHLIILGHTRIAFAYSNAANLQTSSVHERWLGYRKALMRYELPFDESLIIPDLPLPPPVAPNSYDSLFLPGQLPSAIFAVNDTVALALLQAAQRQGVRVPEDLALVGFDDLSFASYLTPPLTTVAQVRNEIGVRAANLLINRIEGQVYPFQHIEIPTNLIIRDSCGARLYVKQHLFHKKEQS